MIALVVVAVIVGVYLGGSALANRGVLIVIEVLLALFLIWLVGRRHLEVKN
jgi:hypothetical protein